MSVASAMSTPRCRVILDGLPAARLLPALEGLDSGPPLPRRAGRLLAGTGGADYGRTRRTCQGRGSKTLEEGDLAARRLADLVRSIARDEEEIRNARSHRSPTSTLLDPS